MAAYSYPSKGVITFYEYKHIKTFDELNPKDDIWRDAFLAYEIDGTWYAPNDMILGNDNWPVGKVCEMIPHFDPDAEVFYSRVKSYHRMLGSPNWQGYSNPLFFSTVGPSGRVGLQASVDGKTLYIRLPITLQIRFK